MMIMMVVAVMIMAVMIMAVMIMVVMIQRLGGVMRPPWARTKVYTTHDSPLKIESAVYLHQHNEQMNRLT